MRWLGAPARVVVAVLAVVAFLFAFVFPTKAFVAQRGEISDVESDLRTLREQNDVLGEEVARLTDPDEIEQLAREQFNLVLPGEQAYAVIPGSGETAPAPRSEPASGARPGFTLAD